MIRILFFPSVCHVMKGPLNLHMDGNRNTEMSLRGKVWVGGCQEDGTRKEVVL